MHEQDMTLFARQFHRLRQEMDSVMPRETGFEHLTPRERFEGLWDRLDELATQAPNFSSPNRKNLWIPYNDMKSLVIKRSDTKDEDVAVIKGNRTIEAVWYSESLEELFREKIRDENLTDDPNADHEKVLGLLEGSEEYARKRIEELTSET